MKAAFKRLRNKVFPRDPRNTQFSHLVRRGKSTDLDQAPHSVHKRELVVRAYKCSENIVIKILVFPTPKSMAKHNRGRYRGRKKRRNPITLPNRPRPSTPKHTTHLPNRPRSSTPKSTKPTHNKQRMKGGGVKGNIAENIFHSDDPAQIAQSAMRCSVCFLPTHIFPLTYPSG